MKLVDANILLYAYNKSAEHHAACRRWLEQALNDPEPVGFAWQTLIAFIRIATNPRAFAQPLSSSQACSVVDALLQRPNVALVEPGERYWKLLREQVAAGRARADLIADAALAALALEHGATLCSTDRDFLRFGDLKHLDPTRDGTRVG